MICIKKYSLISDTHDGDKYHVKSQESSICPICDSSELIVIGSRKRSVFDNCGKKLLLVIRRLRCRKCKRVHHELPDMIVPYKSQHLHQRILFMLRQSNAYTPEFDRIGLKFFKKVVKAA